MMVLISQVSRVPTPTLTHDILLCDVITKFSNIFSKNKHSSYWM